jgi:uncharacterized protein YjgD (DUF1641 family)
MAEPIPLELSPRDPRRELQCRLQNAPVEHAEALLAGYDLLQSLHDRGIFDLLHGALGAGDKIIEEAVQTTNTPEAIRAARNTAIFIKTIGAIEPELLNAFLSAIPCALAEAKTTRPPGFWAIFRQFRGTELRRGLAMVNAFLEGFGRNIAHEIHRGENEKH